MSSNINSNKFMLVNVYEVVRCYGGAEEGGWWYDREYLVCSSAWMPEEKAWELAAELKKGKYNNPEWKNFTTDRSSWSVRVESKRGKKDSGTQQYQ